MKSKRLFLFASYDRTGVIDASVIFYVQALAKMGDVIFYMDNDATDMELNKIKPFVLFADAVRHGEYDFGSYKRGYSIARDMDILKNYSHVYFVNDSMYAPLHPICPLIKRLESQETDAMGIVFNAHKDHPHLQSWFIGTGRRIFLSDWFYDFIMSVKKMPNKEQVVACYEHGFTSALAQHNMSWTWVFKVKKHAIYNNIKNLFIQGLPFMKKISFNRKRGALGSQILYVLNSIDPTLKDIIINNANRVYGPAYVKNILTKNIFKIAYRYIKHSVYKFTVEGV